jgi:hypothetical protein
MVMVAALIRSIVRVAWKAGTQEKVQHVVDPDGTHRIIVTVPPSLAEWEEPHTLTGETYFRDHPDMTWDALKPPPRKPRK